MSKSIPSQVARASRSFHRRRADYYRYMASILTSSKGGTKLLTQFARDAERYEGEPRGVLSAHWHEEYDSNGADLRETWSGTLPDDEVAVISIGEKAGPGGLESALHDVSRTAKLVDRIQTEIIWTMMAAFIGVAVAVFMATVFPVFSSMKLQETFSFLPTDVWGKSGQRLLAYVEWVKAYAIYVVFFVGLAFYAVYYSMSNWVGNLREYADEKILLYKVYRDIKGALFLATLATLTKKRGNVSYTLREALNAFRESVTSRWMRWRVKQIIENMDDEGAIGTSAFKTNLLSPEMYFYLRDTQEAQGIAEGFLETGAYVEATVADGLAKRLMVYRWCFLLGSLLVVATILFWQMAVIREMKDAMSLYYTTR